MRTIESKALYYRLKEYEGQNERDKNGHEDRRRGTRRKGKDRSMRF